jgi:hypothetical protein
LAFDFLVQIVSLLNILQQLNQVVFLLDRHFYNG